jgi:hypothetical protein
MPRLFKEKSLVIGQIQHLLDCVPCHPMPLECDCISTVVKEHSMGQHKAHLAFAPNVVRRLFDERGRYLLVWDGDVILQTPAASQGTSSCCTSPRWIPNNYGHSARQFDVATEKVPTENVASTRFTGDEPWKYPSFLLQLLNISRGKLVEKRKVEAKGCNPAGRLIDVDTVQASLHKLHQLSCFAIVSGLGILHPPFFSQTVEQTNEEDPGAACWIQKTLAY